MTSNLLENVQVELLSYAVTRNSIIYFGNSSKIGICFRVNHILKKPGVENLKNCFLFLGLL